MLKSLMMLIAATSLICACNTFEGIGKDLGAAGNAISGTAEKTKEKMSR